MTIGNIYVEFDKITALGCPWGITVGPWEHSARSFGAFGASWGLIGVPRGLLGALLNPTAKTIPAQHPKLTFCHDNDPSTRP